MLLVPLAGAMAEVAATVRDCECAATSPPGSSARSAPTGAGTGICVVETVADLWAMERGGAFRGRYHVLGGVLSALDGVGPEALRIPGSSGGWRGGGREVILAHATVDGQTTAHYIADELAPSGER